MTSNPSRPKAPTLTDTINRLQHHLQCATPSNNNQPSHSDVITILQWNVQSMRSYQKKAYVIAAIKGHNPDVVLLQETNIPEDVAPTIPGYHVFHKPGTRGLITAVRKGIPCILPSDALNLGRDVEALAVDVTLKDGPIRIYNIYRNCNPRHPGILNADLLFQNSQRPSSIIAGDFNAHHPLWGTHLTPVCSIGRSLAEALEDSNFVILNSGKSTHINGGCIDLTFASAHLAPHITWDVLDSVVSDHFGISITVSLPKEQPTNLQPRRNYAKANWNTFASHLTTILQDYTPSIDVNKHNQQIVTALNAAAEIAIPLHKKRTPRQNAWYYSPRVRAARHIVNVHTRQLKRDPTPYNKQRLREAQQYAKEILAEERSTKWLEWCSKLNQHTTVSSMWKQLRIAAGASPQPPSHPSPSQQASTLNEDFTNRTKSENLPPTARNLLNSLCRNRLSLITDCIATQDYETDRQFTYSELKRSLRSENTAPGDDSVTHSVLKNASDAAHQAILDLINHSYHKSILPEDWKKANIIPIPKPHQLNSYRPISLTSCLSKLAERMILQRLRWKVGPLNPNVYGFTKGASTAHAFSTLLHLISFQQRHRPYVVFLDLEKAFELANPTVITALLAGKGVTGKLLAWVCDFLKHRQSRVNFQNHFSDFLPLENGTPQGSVLSPYLFNLLMDALVRTELPPGVHVLSYADDLAIIATGYQAFKHLQTALKDLSTCINRLGLKISVDKTKAMALLGPDPPKTLKINGISLQWVQSYPYLGINVDKQLDFDVQLDTMNIRILKRLNFMRSLSAWHHGANSCVLHKFYVASVRSIIDYASPVLIIAKPSYIDKLNKLQNTAMRIILGAPRWTKISTMQETTNLVPITHRINYIATSFIIAILTSSKPFLIRESLLPLRPQPAHPQTSWLSKAAFLRQRHLLQFDLLQNNELQNPLPPWHPDLATICISLPKDGKARADPNSLRIDALERIAQLNQHKDAIFYTDGSVTHTPKRAGSGVVIRARNYNNELSIRVADHATTLQTELLAINVAITTAVLRNFNNIIIHTDSLSSLHSLQILEPTENTEMLFTIQNHMRRIYERGGHVTLHWIPSHVGIPLNEAADHLANKATDKTEVDLNVPYSKSQLKRQASKTIRDTWTQAVNHAAPLSESIQWKRTTSPNGKFVPPANIPRHVETKLYRLILGYRCSWEIGHRSLRQCAHCDADIIEPLIHFVLHCPQTHLPPYTNEPTQDADVANIAANRIQRALLDIDSLALHLSRFTPPR